jgi:hypothetical protein
MLCIITYRKTLNVGETFFAVVLKLFDDIFQFCRCLTSDHSKHALEKITHERTCRLEKVIVV